MNFPAICAVLLLQSVISIRPGFVHFADGKTDVRKSEQLEEGRRIETGPNSRVEIGLGPDAVLRLSEDSAAVLESLDKADLSIRLESGTALVEVEDIEKPNRIRMALQAKIQICQVAVKFGFRSQIQIEPGCFFKSNY